MSKNRAKVVILGHVQTGMGEKIRAIKLQSLIERSYDKPYIIDLIQLLGDIYEPLAQINYALAEHQHPLLEMIKLPEAAKLKNQIKASSPEILLILSWNFSLAALFALGIQHDYPTIATLCAHHPNEQILPALYEPAALLITESLLANERGLAYGISQEKMLYLPHPYPIECDTKVHHRTYVESLSERLGKKVEKNTLVIGVVSRLDYGKNCEFAIEVAHNLYQQGYDILLVIKGNFSSANTCPEYSAYLLGLMHKYSQASWLLWDPQETSFPEVLDEYASFDLCLLLSGAECGSHVVGEWLALGKPTLVLDCSTHRSLYGEGVIYVKTTGEIQQAQLPFYTPEKADLQKQLERLIQEKSLREHQGHLAKKIARHRFHPNEVEKRLPLLFDRNKKAIRDLYDHDRKAYGF